MSLSLRDVASHSCLDGADCRWAVIGCVFHCECCLGNPPPTSTRFAAGKLRNQGSSGSSIWELSKLGTSNRLPHCLLAIAGEGRMGLI